MKRLMLLRTWRVLVSSCPGIMHGGFSWPAFYAKSLNRGAHMGGKPLCDD